MNKGDTIRLEEFHQVRKEIRGSGDYLIVPQFMSIVFYFLIIEDSNVRRPERL